MFALGQAFSCMLALFISTRISTWMELVSLVVVLHMHENFIPDGAGLSCKCTSNSANVCVVTVLSTRTNVGTRNLIHLNSHHEVCFAYSLLVCVCCRTIRHRIQSGHLALPMSCFLICLTRRRINDRWVFGDFGL